MVIPPTPWPCANAATGVLGCVCSTSKLPGQTPTHVLLRSRHAQQLQRPRHSWHSAAASLARAAARTARQTMIVHPARACSGGFLHWEGLFTLTLQIRPAAKAAAHNATCHDTGGPPTTQDSRHRFRRTALRACRDPSTDRAHAPEGELYGRPCRTLSPTQSRYNRG